ncbi:conserved hypothetical protein [Ricinus communis]|uniref:Uncharacterized protein n=1 Tax=Ricinus communis TaxID=3988 RepID=B9TJA5_RICCO|nr:conserved hypothetical protein [Ricinus communis]
MAGGLFTGLDARGVHEHGHCLFTATVYGDHHRVMVEKRFARYCERAFNTITGFEHRGLLKGWLPKKLACIAALDRGDGALRSTSAFSSLKPYLA